MNQNRYEIYRGREINGELVGLKLGGYAFQTENEGYYGPGYTIFTKMVTNEDGKVHFQNPVGFGKLMDHIRTHIYIKFSDLSSNMYMSLFPSEKNMAA